MLMGIRFFDIRCKNFDEILPIHHEDYYLGSTFNDVLREVTNYPSDHPHDVGQEIKIFP